MLQIEHIALFVEQLAPITHFYGLLGGKVTSKPSDSFVEIDLGTVSLHVMLNRKQNTYPAPKNGKELRESNLPLDHFCFRVENESILRELEETFNSLSSLSKYRPFEIKTPQSHGPGDHLEARPATSVLYVCDPAGNKLELRCY